MQSYADPDCRNSWARHISSPRSRELILTVRCDVCLLRRRANISKLTSAVSVNYTSTAVSHVLLGAFHVLAPVIAQYLTYITDTLHTLAIVTAAVAPVS